MIQKTLSNGLTVILDPRDRSVLELQLWVPVGSSHEPEGLEGGAHLIEHMRFKGGVGSVTPKDIVVPLEAIGGSVNAFTQREFTSYHVTVPEGAHDLGLATLKRLILGSGFLPEDFAKEKQVVISEIQEDDDDPMKLFHELHIGRCWPGQAIAKPIGGTPESVNEMDLDELKAFAALAYDPRQCVLVAAGRVIGWDDFFKDAEVHLGPWQPATTEPQPFKNPELIWGEGAWAWVGEENHSQAHVSIDFPAYSLSDPKQFPLLVLATLLGGGMSSLLFQRVREDLGLVYDISAHEDLHRGGGSFCVEWSCDPSKLAQTLDEVRGVLASVAAGGLTDAQRWAGIRQTVGELRVAQDSLSQAANRAAMAFMLNADKDPEFRRLLNAIHAVQLEDLVAVAAEVLGHPEPIISVMAPTTEHTEAAKAALDRYYKKEA